MSDSHTPPSPDLDQILIQVMERVTEFLEVERSTLFLADHHTRELWTPVAQGTGEIRIPADSGIAGHVFTSGETLRIPDAYADPRFNSRVDQQTGYRTHDIFCRPISNSAGQRIGVIQLINRRRGPMTPRDEELLDAICNQAGIAIENAQLFLGLKKVRDSERLLHGELETKHAELRSAFLRIEESATAQELLGRRMQRVRLFALIAIVGLFVAIGVFVWLGSSRVGQPRSATSNGPIQWHTVGTAPVRTGIILLGNIEPLEIVNITAPLRGRIAEMNFSYGEPVTKGQLLARIDTTEVEVELRNAETALFKARSELRRLEDWDHGPEVARAKRNLLKARLSYEANQRNLTEMEKLSSLGIIAQTSLDSANQQFVVQEADYRSAQEELDGVLAQATEDRVTAARYDVTNTELRVTELRDKVSRASLFAPFSGVVILPNARPTAGRSAGSDGFFEAGSTIAQNEILLALGNLSGVAVKTRADEVDIAGIRHDQPVRITGDAFAGHVLQGHVDYISSQAILTGPRPFFEVLVKTRELTPAQLSFVRLGMTAKLDITTYDETSALVAPVTAVRSHDGGNHVYRRNAAGQPEDIAVTIGVTTPEVVEIRAGLQAGDVIATDAATVTP